MPTRAFSGAVMGAAQKVPEADSDLPPPSWESVALGIYWGACFRATEKLETGRIKARGFRKCFAEEIEEGWRRAEEAARVVKMISPSRAQESQLLVKQARAWYDQFLSHLAE